MASVLCPIRLIAVDRGTPAREEAASDHARLPPALAPALLRLLDLQPRPCPPADVGRRRILGYQTLVATLEHFGPRREPIWGKSARGEQEIVAMERVLEPVAPRLEREPPEIAAGRVQAVERHVERGDRQTVRRSPPEPLVPRDQGLVKSGHLAVQNQRGRRQRGDGGGEFGEIVPNGPARGGSRAGPADHACRRTFASRRISPRTPSRRDGRACGRGPAPSG